MKWQKLGRIFDPDNEYDGLTSHASVPFVDKLKHDVIKIYYTSRYKGKSYIHALNYNLKESKIEQIDRMALLGPGKIGEFDFDGVMGCQILEINGCKYVYYIGWNKASSVPFRNAIGLAKLSNEKISRVYRGPILDRSIYDPCFVASCCVIRRNTQFLMYYVSCIEWKYVDQRLRHYYHIKIAKSKNGFNWTPTGKIAINFKNENEYAISVPRVIVENGIYKMFYSYREDIHTKHYMIGYAESKDGYSWSRKDRNMDLQVSECGWDCEMICYPYIFDYAGDRYLLYNGNDYGRTGIGLAVLISE